MARHPDTIRANIAAQEARYGAAMRDMETGRYNLMRDAAMSYSEALDEMGRAARRLYNLRRELARAAA